MSTSAATVAPTASRRVRLHLWDVLYRYTACAVPTAQRPTALLLFEPSSVVNTGDAGGELTAEVEHLT